MAKEGKIELDDFAVLDQRQDDLKNLHSTSLYPEWYMSATADTDGALREKVKAAPLKLGAGDPASKTGKIAGFVVPLNLSGLVATLKALSLPPFDG